MNNWTIRGRLTSDGGFWPHATARIAGAVVAVLIMAVVLSVLAGSPAQAQTCPDAGDPPTPTEVAVTAVPIVVESTTADYFVLYAGHDVDGATVEYPVRVVLGEEGTTTLGENVEALPRERYRVEKYLVEDPADVDGDCTDDITELNDLGRMNPVNPGVAVDLSDGAVAIPDRETFETLAYSLPSGMFYVKYIILGIGTNRPSVYFMNTNKFQHHPHFLRAIGFDIQGAFRSTMIYDPELVAPDGSHGAYRYGLPRPGESVSFVERTYTLLAASMPLLNGNLALWIRNQTLPMMQADLPLYRASRVNLVFDKDIHPETNFMALNPGEGYGLLRNLDSDERPNSRDVVIYEALPNELPRVAGIISTVPQTQLSHVNLRALQDSIPNAFIPGALEDDTVSGLIDGYVHYAVTETGYSIRAASQSEVDEHYASSRPAESQTPQRDLTVTEITALSEIGFDDWDSFGVKAANVAVLGTLDFPEGTVPDGFAVPFYFYDEFMKHNGLYDDVREMLADSDFQTDYDTKVDKLKDLRKKIKKAETPEWIDAALTEMHAEFTEGTSLRYRSSTNNEDLPGFNGAGLYDSKTQHPEETEEDGISKSLKQVYASLWNFRAFIERDFYRIDHLAAAMGVLVHPNYSDELVNGVAVSFDPVYSTGGTHYVNSQVGEDLVTNPEAHSVPEEVLLYPNGTYSIAALSNQVPRGQLLMTDDQLAQLRRHLAAVHDKFAELYGIEDGERFAMEIEFKITSGNVLAIKQARPWIFADPLTGSFDDAPATHDANAFRVRIEFSDGISTGEQEFRDHAVTVTNGKVTDARRVSDGDGLWQIEVTPDSGAHVTIVLAADRPCTVAGAICTDNGRRLSTRLEHTAKGGPPAVPDPQTGTALWSGIVDLEWNDNPGAESYEVQLFHNSWFDLPGRGVSVAFYGPGAVIKDLPTDINYYFRVRAVNSNGVSEWSDYLPMSTTHGPMHWTDVPEPANSPATGAPTISGTAEVGETLTADGSAIADENGLDRVQFHYQWTRSDGTEDTDIEGATHAYYTLTTEDSGRTVSVRVSFVDRHGFAETVTSGPVEVAGGDANTPATGAPTITGTARVGETLTADTSEIADEDGLDNVSFSYQWLADDTEIVRAIGSRYTITDSDEGKAITVRVSFTDGVGYEESLTSAAKEAQGRGTPPDAPNQPTGTALWSGIVDLEWNDVPRAESYEVQLFHNSWLDLPGKGVSVAFYGPGAVIRDLPTNINYYFRIRAINSHGSSEWSDYISMSTTHGPLHWTEVPEPSNTPATGTPTISGTPAVTETLTADVSGIADENGLERVKFRYQWMSSDSTTYTDIAGATEVTYTLTRAEVGKTIKVRVSFIDRHGFVEALTSEATETVPAHVNRPPVLDGPSSVNYAENSTPSVASYSADDPEDDSITWAVQGIDSAAFAITDGVLEFLTPPNFENPGDHDGDNEYVVEVVATDVNEASTSLVVTITVTDVPDPNIILILADDIGYEIVGANGSTQYSTLHIDELASGGVRFTNAHSKPCCASSRVALMTGKSNVRNYIDRKILPPNEYQIVHPFRKAGYATAIAGKWMLHGDVTNNLGVDAGAGFDTYCLWGTEKTKVKHVRDETKVKRYWNAFMECDGQLIQLEKTEYGPDVFVDFLIEFIESNRDRPFFVYYPMVLAHAPFKAPPQSQCSSGDQKCIFEDMVAYMDHNVGRLHDKLAELKLLDNTVVVFTSDNGTHSEIVSVLGGETIYGDKGTTSDISTHVPLIAHVPGGIGGRVIDDLIDFTDLLPTLSDAAGLTLPDTVELDGVSFWERLQGRAGQPREWLYTYYFPSPYESSFDSPSGHPEVAFARDWQYKLYHTGELFDVSVDPHELYPLPDDHEESSDARAKLQAALDSMPDKGQAIEWSRVTGNAEEARPRWRPVLSGATVNGTELTLTYAGIIETAVQPAVDSFSVKVEGIEWTVSAVSINSSTVTLTLDSPVTIGQTVTVSYTRGMASTSIQHANMSRGHFAAELTDRAVTNVTPPDPLTASIHDAPESHDGQNSFTFELRLSEHPPSLRNVTLRDHAFSVTGGDVVGVRRLEPPSNIWWEIQVRPDSNAEVTVALPVAEDCEDEGAICTDDGRRLSNSIELTVPGPNIPATGVPTISGTVRVGETLTADTTGIADADGLDNATYTYRWIRNDGASDEDIQDAAGSTYTLDADDEDKIIKVRVSFTDDGGNPETLTSTATAAVEAAVDEVVWESDLTAGQETDVSPVSSGYSIFGDLGGTLSPDEFVIDGTTYNVKFLTHVSGSLWLGMDGELPVDFTLRVGDSAYLGSESMVPPAIDEVGVYWWPSAPPDWSADDPAQVSLTIHPGVPLGSRPKAPVTGYFSDFPSEHDGGEDITFRIYFSEGVAVTAKALRDHVLTVSSGTVSTVEAVGNEGRIWAVSVKPDSMDTVTVDMEADLDCEVAGAVCAADGRRLFNRMELTVDGPAPEPENSPATGAPTISGSAQVGETLTADTSGIADDDGLDNVSFNYQWLADDTEIQGAIDSSYTLVTADAGKAVKVSVSFTDDAGNEETLTSAPTEPVTVLVWSATLTAGSSGTYSGYSLSDSTGALSTDAFSLGAIDYSVKLVAEDDEGRLSFVLDHALLTTFTLHVGALRFSSEDASPTEADHRYIHRWDKGTVDWSAGDEVELALTLSNRPLMAAFADSQPSHDGQEAFTFELRFSEEFYLSYVTLRDHAFTVTGGEVTKARRLEKPGNTRWEITVRPDGDGEVAVALPVTGDCDDQGAICTQDGRRLSNRTELTVPTPGS